MHPLVALLLFAGLALVMHSVYEDKYKRLKSEVRIEYRFIPRTLYEEQMAQTDLTGLFANMFERDTLWGDSPTSPGGEKAAPLPSPTR